MDRRGILLGTAGLAALSFSLSPRLALAQGGTAHWLSGSEYMAKTLMGGTLAIETSKLAQERGQHPKVKQFAGFEIAEQIAMAQVLTNTANPPPVPLDADHQAVLRTLQAQTGPGFDRAYILSQLQLHQALLLAQQGYLDNTNRSTDTQNIAVLARMSIQQHLVMLQEIQQMLG
jgi:predicted outer membrane protein